MKKNKGITLIALVITIIVMLILVVVTIRISTNGGLFDYAGKAARETNDAITDETDIANGKIKIGGITYNSIEEYINRSNLYGIKLKYKVEDSNILIYFEDSYTDYLETNSLEASGDNRNAYEAYIKNKIANIASKKSTEEKENYIVEQCNEDMGTTFSTIEEVINECWKNEENFIAETEATTYEDAINKLYENVCYERFMNPIEKITLPNNQIIQKEVRREPYLSRNKTYIYCVTESGTYTFTATNRKGETTTLNVPVTIQKTDTTKFATLSSQGVTISIRFEEGQKWEDVLGESGINIFGNKLYKVKSNIRVKMNKAMLTTLIPLLSPGQYLSIWKKGDANKTEIKATETIEETEYLVKVFGQDTGEIRGEISTELRQ